MIYTTYNIHNFLKIPQIQNLSKDKRFEIKALARIQPFRTNNYVVNELINWEDIENDPMFILNFPNKGMLSNSQYNKIVHLVKNNVSEAEIASISNEIWRELNPHPAGQMDLNVPVVNDERLIGLQHKYKETVLFFPTQGQTCHAYCTFCFRWPLFIGKNELKFAMKQSDLLIKYLKMNKQVTDLLITGGDPMIMTTNHLSRYINAILDANISHLKSIRIGTKALSYWPYRFISDPDSMELLTLFRKVVKKGKHLAIMANINHPTELSTIAVKKAIKNILKTGAQIRSQSPLLNHINANSNIWAKLWRDQISLGIIPYYMFITRNTGSQEYFGVPLDQACRIFRGAYSQVSGLCRTVRGPSMSCGPGKIQIVGITEIKGEKVFVLNFIQARDSKWTRKPFFAKFSKSAYWLNDLKPAFGDKEFFFDMQYQQIINEKLNNQNFDYLTDNEISLCS